MYHKSHPSLKCRQRKVLGTFQFQTPVTPQNRKAAGGLAASESTPPENKRREQALKAQRDHRKRTQEYISALEAEVLRLRAEETRLQSVSDTWMQWALTLMESRNDSADGHITAVEGGTRTYKPFQPPGMFLWVIAETSGTSNAAANQMTVPTWQLLLWQAQRILEFRRPTILPYLNTVSAAVHELLQIFCENIAPTLNITESSTYSYLNRIMPLAMVHPGVQSFFLAASAGHMQSLRGTTRVAEAMKYRTAAIR
ncbi:hypothetical protein BJY04DRAFT_213646 [Aspergillus karnatakaensis]|uniref:uncharacterized protein n=1 Tax=Aspergillus karnatakaensis TaxID=1810916 RepID=UPI003CCC9F7D